MNFRRRQPRRVGIDIAPLVDVVFLLVIFFAVSTTFLETSGMKLDLPSSSSTAERESREVSVALSAEGQIEFDGRVVAREDLGALLKSALAGRDSKVVVLRADSRTPHGQVVALMDVIRGAGADALTIATRSPGS